MFYFAGIEQEREGKNMNGRNRGDVRVVKPENARSSEKIGGGYDPSKNFFKREWPRKRQHLDCS